MVTALVDLSQLALRTGEADVQPFDLAVPSFAFGLGDAGDAIVADVSQPGPLGRIRSEERASDTSMLVNAVSAIGPSTVPERELAPLEVAEEFLPLPSHARAASSARIRAS